MKSLAHCLVLLLMSSVAAAQGKPPNLERDRLRGPVKTVEYGRIQYILSGGKPVEGKRTLVQKLAFDERGNRSESTTYREDEKLAEKLVYTYDVLGRNTGYNEYYALTSQALLGPRKHIYTLDANGKIVEYVVHETDGMIASRFIYKYDHTGNKLEESFYSWTGKNMGRLVYTYDEVGHLLTQTSYDGDDGVDWKNISSYDPEGHQIEWAQYQKGVLRYKRTFKYDDKGRIKEQETREFNAPPNLFVSHAPIPGKIVYVYNDRERSREIVTYEANGTLKSRDVRRLDEKGTEIGSSFSSANKSSLDIAAKASGNDKPVGTLSASLQKVEYDSHGNWIKKVRLILPAGAKEPEAQSAEYRNIAYYE